MTFFSFGPNASLDKILANPLFFSRKITKKKNISRIFSSDPMPCSFFISPTFWKIVSSQNLNSSKKIERLLGKCL